MMTKRNDIRLGTHGEDYGNWMSMPVFYVFGGLAILALILAAVSFVLLHIAGLGVLFTAAAAVLVIFLCRFYRIRRQYAFGGGNIMENVHNSILSHLRYEGRGTLLDVGCGSGALSIRAALIWPETKVIGVDSWGAMYGYSKALCEKNAASEGVGVRCEFRRGDADRMTEIYETPVAEGTEVFAPKGHDIVFEHVDFAYDKKDVLHDVSFTAKEGEVTALVGPSGSGKSTCARLAARLWDVTGGAVKVGGVDISTVDPEVLLTDYSMVFQDVVLFDDTIMENIRLGKHGATDEEVLAAAKAANCDEFARRLPQGYDTPIGENGAKLSGGERQRISIARALLKDAPIVLLDEATASLDVENETKVQGALSRLLQGKTVLVIAHRMRTVEAADKIVVLADGKVAEEGSPQELMEKGGLFRRMVELQRQSAKWQLG